MADSLTALFSYHAETAGVMVRVAVAYLAEQSSPEAGRWFWSYHIRIENIAMQPCSCSPAIG